MRRLIGWLGAFLAGTAGWWLGAKAGLGTAVLLGAVAGGAGMYAGYRWFDMNLK
jgi:4-hydroxybenzoate polyprenyltransferase